MINDLLLLAIVFGSSLTLSVAGFGVALIGMPLLSWLLGVQVAAPLVALYGIILNFAVLLRYRVSFNYRAVTGLIVSSLAGVPVGVWALGNINETIILRVLGLVLIGYSLYALFTPRLPAIGAGHGWAYGFGFISGCLGGAYNAFGPPIIIYGNLRGWLRNEFKSNLQGFFLLNAVVVVVVHGFNGNLNWPVWRSYLLAVPASLLGLLLGLLLDRYINQALFTRLVLILLLGLGVSLAV